jgi:hypothetical protein
MWRLKIVVSLAIFLITVGALAQGGGNVAITGTVTDQSGAVVTGAKVTVTQANTSFVRTDTTNSAGQFNVPSLPPATYNVNIQATGFKGYVQNVTLLADQIRNMDIGLEVGAQTQQVTVQDSAIQVNTVSQELSHVIERDRLVDLPLNGRNAADLTLLVPGAVSANANNSGALQGDTKQIPGAEAFAVNGARPDQIGYNLDGGNNEDLMSNTNDPFPFPDALQEFSVQTNSFDVQYGSNAGAVVNVVTRSGTNQWHGNLFEFVRNGDLNAWNRFGFAKDPLKRNQFGATVGGPIFKDHTFMFFGWQKTIIRSKNNASQATLPLPQNLTGDFTNYSTVGPTNPLSSPVLVTQNPYTHALLTTPNMIPSGLIDPVAINMAKLLPLASEKPNGITPYGTPIQQNFDEYVARVDQVFRGQDRLFGRFYLNRYKHAPTFDGKNLLTVGPGSTVQTQNWAVGYTWVVSPNIVNNLVLDAVRSASDRGQQGGPGGTAPDMKTFGSTMFQLPTAQSGIRSFNVSGNFNIGNFTDAMFVRNTADLRDVLTWNKGRHNFSMGYDLEIDQSIIRNTDLENGNFSFTNDVSGLALANFIMGYQHQFSQTSGDFSDSHEKPMGLFVSDRWKATPRLSLTYGLRWEPQQVMKEIRGRIEQFRPDAYAAGIHSTIIPGAPAGLFFVGDNYNGVSVPDRGESGDLNNFAPRLGFAWDPTGKGKMALRGGGGLFYYSRLPGLFLNDAAISAPFSLRIDLNDSGNTSGPSQIGTLTNPVVNYPSFSAGFPQRFILANAPKNATFVANPTVFGLQPGVKWVTPEIYDWNVTYEYQLRHDTVAHVSYVGTRGTHLRQDVNLNPGVYGGTGSLQSRRPYQPFGTIYQNRNSGANGYNALQLDFEKRPSGAGVMGQITLLANYTYSKAMDYGLSENGGITDIGSSIGSGMSFYDPRQHAFETGLSTYNHTHRFVGSFVWQLPKLTGENGFVRSIAGGWQWTGLYTFQTGDPLTLLAGTDISQTGNGLDRVDYTGPADQFGKTAAPSQRSGCGTTNSSLCVGWLNISYFAAPAAGTYGNSGKANWTGPNLWDADTGLLKMFYPMPSHENINFQFRGEFFNVFNHPQWADPNVTKANGAFGSIRGTILGNVDYRIIQLALKMNF